MPKDMLGKEINVGSLVAMALTRPYSETGVMTLIGRVCRLTPKKVRVTPLGQRPQPVTIPRANGKSVIKEVINPETWKRGFLEYSNRLILIEDTAVVHHEARKDVLGQPIDVGDLVAVPYHFLYHKPEMMGFVICKIKEFIGPGYHSGMIRVAPVIDLPNRASYRIPESVEYRWRKGSDQWSYELLKLSDEDVFVYVLSTKDIAWDI